MARLRLVQAVALKRFKDSCLDFIIDPDTNKPVAAKFGIEVDRILKAKLVADEKDKIDAAVAKAKAAAEAQAKASADATLMGRLFG